MITKCLSLMAMSVILLMTGCATVDLVGTIGQHDIYSIETTAAFAPSTTTIVTHDTKTGELSTANRGAGSGVMGTVAMPAATLGTGIIMSRGLEAAAKARRPDQVNVQNGNTITNQGSQAVAGALAGASSSSKSNSSSSNTVVNQNNNSNTQSQGQGQNQDQFQGQAQGQSQGQNQGQSNNNHNHNNNNNNNNNNNSLF